MSQPNSPEMELASKIVVPNLRKEGSVRTTFRLDQRTVVTAESIALENKLSLREVVDTAARIPIEKRNFFELRADATFSHEELPLLRKTYVMSVSAVSYLKKQSEMLRISRSKLLSIQLEFLHLVLKQRVLLRCQNLPKARQIVDELWTAAESVEDQLKELLPDDEKLLEQLGTAIVNLMNLSNDISSEIEEDLK